MKTSRLFGFRSKKGEEKLLLQLAEHLERDNLSDVLRFAIRHTARSYGLLPQKSPPSVVRAKRDLKKRGKGGEEYSAD